MTRANNAPWFTKAGAATSILPISHFVGPNIFALKGGGYGCLFSLEASTPRAAPTRIWTFECAASKPPCADSRKAPASTSTPASSPASISPAGEVPQTRSRSPLPATGSSFLIRLPGSGVSTCTGV
jgi:hypothetical protein